MSKMASTLEVLNDGKWHAKKELQKKLELKATEVEKITDFLENFGFVKIDSEKQKVKQKQDFQNLLNPQIILL